MKCERCDKEGDTKIVATKEGTQRTHLCARCISIVITPSTNFQVVKEIQ